jgi:hypothetical protein
MKPILILAEDTRPGRCRSCGAPLEWATTINGKSLPFDPPIVRIPTFAELPQYVSVDMDQTTSHFATCPQASHWRSRVRR